MRIAYVLATFPALTERFIHREIDVVAKTAGFELSIFALKPANVRNDLLSQVTSENAIYARDAGVFELVLTCLAVFFSKPAKIVSLAARLLISPSPFRGYRKRVFKHLIVGIYWSVTMCRKGIEYIHAHYANGPATIAYVVHELTGIPFSFTAHAYDIYFERFMLKEKLEAANLAITCTAYNKHYIEALVGSYQIKKLHHLYHGVEVIENHQMIARSEQTGIPLILSIGSLVEQKGYPYLVEAASILSGRGYKFRLKIVGKGPEEKLLRNRIGLFSLEHCVEILPYLQYEEIDRLYCQASVFVLASIIATTGERDGIPNVLIEAMALGVPVVSTWVSGIPELIKHGHTGLLVPERNPEALADALEKVLSDKELRTVLARNAFEHVKANFELSQNVKSVLKLFLARKSLTCAE